MKILFLVPYPTEGASNRVRVEQFIPYLKRDMIAYKIRPFVNKHFFRILYKPRRYISKTFWFSICTINRILDLIRAFRYDVVFVHREAYPFGSSFFESILHRIGKPLIFDFDDAIFLPSTSEENIYIERFKNPNKTSRIITLSSWVIAGNRYLEDYALKFNRNVTVIPSCVDTEKYCPPDIEKNKSDITIGWIGSITTRNFLYDLDDVFKEISHRYSNVVFKFIGAVFSSKYVKNVVNKEWVLQEEVGDIQSFDIGIMPMPDNKWTRGKCGFKIILYMACGVPVVSSPVGVNKEIINEGINGFFANTEQKWIEKLSKLIEKSELRNNFRIAGRRTVEEMFSVSRYAPQFITVLKDALNNKGKKRSI